MKRKILNYNEQVFKIGLYTIYTAPHGQTWKYLFSVVLFYKFSVTAGFRLGLAKYFLKLISNSTFHFYYSHTVY